MTVGFFDFMLADPRTGRLIYTVQKEVDFTTSLQVGPYRNTNVAAIDSHLGSGEEPQLGLDSAEVGLDLARFGLPGSRQMVGRDGAATPVEDIIHLLHPRSPGKIANGENPNVSQTVQLAGCPTLAPAADATGLPA